MTLPIDMNTPATAPEAAKLIQEMQHLIEAKKLQVELTPVDGYELPPQGVQDDICTHCTLCPCMFIG